jgi:hypothetical protein
VAGEKDNEQRKSLFCGQMHIGYRTVLPIYLEEFCDVNAAMAKQMRRYDALRFFAPRLKDTQNVPRIETSNKNKPSLLMISCPSGSVVLRCMLYSVIHIIGYYG